METMAIMCGVHVGLRDTNYPCMWFETKTDECSGALQVLNWEEAGQVIKDAGVYDVSSLEGRPCWVSVEGGLMRFLRVWKKV